jgi:dephospho-CoA kinase
MRRIALTGGIATGKSYVAARLRAAGLPVVDADVLAREAVAPGSDGLAAVAARFGPGVLQADGALDRKALAAVVFGDAAARRALEAIVHPRVRAATEAFFAALPPATPLAVADIPLLFETGRDRDFDEVVVVACDPRAQVARVMARDGASRDDAERRIAAQWPIADKVARADRVIRTDGTFAETDAQVEALVDAWSAGPSR